MVLAVLPAMSIIFYLFQYYEVNGLFILSWYNLYLNTIPTCIVNLSSFELPKHLNLDTSWYTYHILLYAMVIQEKVYCPLLDVN